MRRSLIRLEMGLLLRERASLGVMAVFAALVAWASWQGGGRVAERRAADALALESARQRAEELGAGERVTAAELGLNLRPVAILAPRGLAGVVDREAGPTRVEVTTAPVLEAKARDALDAQRLAAGPLDLLFVLIQLLPLVVIALSYDIVSGDRERGTLALLLAQPLRLRDLLVAKSAARLLALGAVGLVASAVAWASGAISVGDGSDLGETLAMGGLVVLWTAFWFAAALAVNAWGGASSTNALVLMTLWLGLVVVGPGLLRAGVEAANPPPSRVALATAARDAATASEEAIEAIEGDHRAGKEAERPGMGAGKEAAERELRARLAPLDAGFDEALGAQQGAVDWLRVLSPALTASEGLVALAGEDVARRREWLVDVKAWHAAVRDHFGAHATSGDSATLLAVPAAPHGVRGAANLGARLWLDMLVLVGWVAAALAIAAMGLRRETGRLT
jgi:ABC-2 type transport system permease protein